MNIAAPVCRVHGGILRLICIACMRVGVSFTLTSCALLIL